MSLSIVGSACVLFECMGCGHCAGVFGYAVWMCLVFCQCVGLQMSVLSLSAACCGA